MEKVLEVKDLKISFRTNNGNVKAVRDVSFDVYKGETLGIVGESGSGKSVTARAMLGILAGNKIIEGGELFYEGQDLLRLSETDFYNIRGTKISMIFQDPLSSLNPIMKIGKQITEAMILKAKTSRRVGKHDIHVFNKSLKANLDHLSFEEKHKFTVVSKKYQNVIEKFIILEVDYKQAHDYFVRSSVLIDETFKIIQSQGSSFENLVSITRQIFEKLNRSINPYIITKDNEIYSKESQVKEIFKAFHKKVLKLAEVKVKLTEILELIAKELKEKSDHKKPDFLSIAISEVLESENFNEIQTQYLNFVKIAAENSHKQSIENKKLLLNYLVEHQSMFDKELSEKHTLSFAKQLVKNVKKAVDYLSPGADRFFRVLASQISAHLSDHFYLLALQAKQEKKAKKSKSTVDKVINIENITKAKDFYAKLIDAINENIISQPDFDSNVTKLDVNFREYIKDYHNVVNRFEAKQNALDLMREVGIPQPEKRYNQYPFQFSGGMRQRIVIAIAISFNPDILICDEPTTALDVTIQAQILELINKIKRERNLSVIFITHDLGVIANMADRIAVMYAGKIVEYGRTEELFYNPKHPYTWALLSSIPDLDTKEKLESIPGTPPNMIHPPVGDAFAARNKYALKIDFEQQPPMFKVSDTHYAATWLLHPNAPKVEKPKIVTERIERMKQQMGVNNND